MRLALAPTLPISCPNPRGGCCTPGELCGALRHVRRLHAGRIRLPAFTPTKSKSSLVIGSLNFLRRNALDEGVDVGGTGAAFFFRKS
jgi:hypothetical protein